MKDDIKNRIEKAKANKKQQISLTLSGSSIIKIEDEMKRLDIDSKSFLVELILQNYFQMPIEEEETKEKP